MDEVNRELQEPDVWNNPERAQALGKERAQLEAVVNRLENIDRGLNEVAELLLLAGEEGDEVAVAEDGDDAVQMAAERDFDVILMDIRMPRMDGLTATRAIRALDGRRGRTPIIAVTAEALPEQVARFREAGMIDHIPKPIAQTELYDKINRWIEH